MQTAWKTARQMSESEISSCYKLVRKLRSLYLATPEGWNKQRKLGEMRQSNLEYILITHDDEIAAFVSFERNDRDLDNELCTYIWEFHVSEKFKRQGLGRQLMTTLLESSAHKLLLRSFNANKPAVRFYEAMQFKPLMKYADQFCTLYELAKV